MNKRIRANCIADSTDPVTDIDGNVYHTIRIGNQVWAVEDLRTTRFNDGSPIPLVTETTWNSLKTPAYCYYDSTTDADSIRKYGALYNGYAVQTGKLAPPGWHVASDAEWRTMDKYLVVNGYNYDWSTDTTAFSKIAKALAANTGWPSVSSSDSGSISTDLSKNNSSGFSALPGGYRSNIFSGRYWRGYWWTTSPNNSYLKCCYLGTGYSISYGYSDKYFGFSVRLVKD